ncbi:MAG: PhzF family phenazine biosynthesis protein [Pseudomonadota bacterium]
MKNKIPIYQVDSFTSQPFFGNPAAICLLNMEADSAWMQAVAGEMNLSETAFIRPEGSSYDLRWFTPIMEVDLCGHATLAAAHVLWEQGLLSRKVPANFNTRSGLLCANYTTAGIELEFPATPASPATPPADLLPALGLNQAEVFSSKFDYLVTIGSTDDLHTLKPDFDRLRKIDARGIIVTAPSSTSDYDFVSRFFAPRVGINEDPVTGSAHCALGPFWAGRLGKVRMLAYQASPRGGVINVRLDGNDTVILGGHAVTVLSGELHY